MKTAFQPANARELAYDLLFNAGTEKDRQAAQFVTQRLDERLTSSRLSGSERGLAAEIVQGVVRRAATLDALLKPHINRPLANVEEGARVLLQIGAYQLVLLSGVPPHAAIHETVEIAKRIGQPRWTGFINGVLRSVSRSVTDKHCDNAGPHSVPLADGRFRLLHDSTFPDPLHNPAGYFASAFSFPDWLTQRWLKRFTFDDVQRLGFWFNAPAKLTLRVNSLRGSRDEYLRILREANIAASPGVHPDAVLLNESQRVFDLPGFTAGWFAVQDESALAAATLLAPRPGARVLDLCAAPGGKTAHLAALMRNEGQIVAADVDNTRLARVDENCRRLGITNVETRLISRDGGKLPAGPFDAVLVDVPCSNTGVLGKRPEARWRLRPADIAELVELQTRLLRTALSLCAPNGRVVYSTCSIEPEENRGVVDAVLRETRGWQLSDEILHVPGRPADGGYQALLQHED